MEIKKDNLKQLMQQESAEYIPYGSQSFDTVGYQHRMENPEYMDEPDEYDADDWIRDAWTDWWIMRNEVNYSTELGNYQLDQVKINELDDAERFISLAAFNSSNENKVEIPEELANAYNKAVKDYSLSGTLSQQLQQISQQKQELFDSQNKALDEAKKYQQNAQDWKDKHDISDYYQFKKEEGIFDQYDMDSYLYKLPGIFGSSASSMGWQALGMVAGMGASVAISALSGGTLAPLAGAALATALGSTALASNVIAANRENKAEVFDNLKSRVIEQSLNDGTYENVIQQAKKKLGNNLMTDEEALNAILTNQVEINDEAFNKSVKKALTGTEQLYLSDNMLVLGTESIETAATIIPFGALAKLGKLGKLGKTINKAQTAKSKLYKAINDRIDDVKYFGLDRSAKGLSSMTKRDFVFDLTKRALVQSATEMVEESGQYLNAQDFIAGKYDGQQPSYIQGLVDNFSNGARSLYSFYAPWDTALSSDKEWLENSRSGFILGLLNAPAIGSAALDARRAYKQVKADKFVEDIAVNDIFADKDRLYKNIYYAGQSGKGLESEIINSLNKAKELGIEGIEDSVWEEEIKQAKNIVNLTRSKEIRKLAEERGYKPGTEDFNTFVGMYAYYYDRQKEAVDRYNELLPEVNRITNSADLKSIVDDFYGMSEEELDKLSTEKRKDKDGNELPSEREEAEILQSLFVNAAQYNARLAAYDQLLSDFEALDRDATELYSKFGIAYNKSDLTTVRSVLKQERDKFVNEHKDDAYVKDMEDAEIPTVQNDLIRAYRNIILAGVDVVRSQNDFKDLTTSKEKDAKAVERTQRKINKYKRVQKENQQLEQDIQDNHRQEEKEPEVIPVDVTEGPGDIVQQEQVEEAQPEISEKKEETPVVNEPVVEEKPTEQPVEEEELNDNTIVLGEHQSRSGKKYKITATLDVDRDTPSDNTKSYDIQSRKDKITTFTLDDLLKIVPEEYLEQNTYHNFNGDTLESLEVKHVRRYHDKSTGKTHYYLRGKARYKIDDGLQDVTIEVPSLPEQFKPLFENDPFSNRKQIEQKAEETNDIEQKRKEVLDARKPIVKVTTKPVSQSKAQKNRDAAILRDNNSPRELDYYGQGIAHEYNPDNVYGEAHVEAQVALNEAAKEIDSVIGSIMTAAHPQSAWKYKNGVAREPYFVQSDIDEILDARDAQGRLQDVAEGRELLLGLTPEQSEQQRAAAQQTLDATNQLLQPISQTMFDVFDAFSELSKLQGQLDEAISDVNVEEADKLVPSIHSAISRLKESLDIHFQRQIEEEKTKKEVSRTPSYSEKGHQLINSGETQEQRNDFIAYSAQPDFIINSTFSFETKNGQTFVVFDYKGKKIRTRLSPDSAALGIIDKINEYLKQVQSNPSKQIVPIGIARTNGLIQYGQQERKLTELPEYLGVSDVYDITPENVVIGVGTGSAIRRGTTVLRNQNSELGRIYWFVNVNRPETPDVKRTLPIKLNPVKINSLQGVADLIIQCYEQLKQPEFTLKDGTKTPISPKKLLDFVVYNGSETYIDESKQKRYSAEQLEQMRKKQLYLSQDGKLVIGSTAYDLVQLSSNPELRAKAIEALGEFNFRIQDENLYSNWGNEEFKESNPFYGLKSWFQLYKKDKLTIIPGIIEFDSKMVGLDSTRPKGISVLGYYIDKGLIKTDFTGLVDAKVYIKDVALVDKVDSKPDEIIEKIVTDKQDTQEVESADKLTNFFDALFGPKMQSTQKPDEKVTDPVLEKARKVIVRLTGIAEDQIQTADDVLKVTATEPHTLGRSCLDSIVLYVYTDPENGNKLKTKGVEYHEAWHRISNLLMEDKQREKLFSQVRKKYGKDLSDKEVDEILAERFREFQLGVAETIDYTTTNFFKRIWNFIKTLANLIIVGDDGIINSFKLAKLYVAINRGEFASIKPSAENIERFKRIYGDQGALMTYRGVEFKQIQNSKQLFNYADSFLMFLLEKQEIVDYSDVDSISLDPLKVLLGRSKSPVYQELFQNFDVLQKVIKRKLKLIQVNLSEREEQDALEDNLDEDFSKIDMDDYTKASYEVDKYDNAPAEVKFFFTTVPEMEWSNDRLTYSKDPTTGLPKFVNPRFAWNVILNDLHSISTLQELQDEINKRAQHSTLHAGLKIKLDQLIGRSKNGTPEQKVNAEATLTKIITTIHSHRNRLLTVKGTAETVSGTTTHRLDVYDNNVEIKSRTLPTQYSQAMFAPGGIFEIKENGSISVTQEGKHVLNKVVNLYNMVTEAIRSKNGMIKISKDYYDLHEDSVQHRVKESFVAALNAVGIMIDVGTINEMMDDPVYDKGTTYDRFTEFFINSIAHFGGMRSLFRKIEALRDASKIDPENLTKVVFDNEEIDVKKFYDSNGFVKELAKAFVRFHDNYDNLQSLGANNSLLYAVSQNNFFTDRIDELNAQSEIVEQLSNCKYNSSSLLLEQARNGAKLSAQTFVNFVTNNPNDTGNDYHGITDAEDYVAKMTLVLSRKLICPTIADKKTYHVIDGVAMPNERFKQYGNSKFGRRFVFGNLTVNQILKYALSELEAVEHCINQLTPGNPDYLSEDQRIKNYHTNNKYEVNGDKHSIEPNGTRFRFLTGVYVLDDNGKEKYISFNDPKKSSEQNLKEAKKYFFNQPIENQISLINGILSRRVNEEIKYAYDLGLIAVENGVLVNKLLDDRVIDRRAVYYEKMGYPNPKQVAIMDMIAQYAVNTIISVNEVERVFSGDPAFYKWLYDENGAYDISVDKIKRLGSLNSTGINNRLDFEDFISEYTCAELKDFKVGSRQFEDTLVPLFVDSSIREFVKQIYGIEATLKEDGSNKTVEELKAEYPKEAKLAEARAKSDVSGYGKGINVADAAVYVSPKFYAKMMRSVGYWNSDIAEAYRILTEPANEEERNWESQAVAYQKIMKASLKPLKYTAFGHRFENGLAVPYYNKMALFPLFESVATGDVRKLYDRMVDENDPIDMVLFESAVKAGSKNPLSWKNENGEVNDLSKLTTYKQSMKYLRQQLATDPHTHEDQMAGTQMLKVALANLDLLGNYGFGENKTKGEVIRDTIFAAMNELSNRGRKRLEEKLLDENGNLSEEKLSKLLLEDLETQDADDNIMDGVTFNPETGKMNLPLSAISNNSWLESRFISQINKETIDINLPGGSFIQRSAFGLAADQTDVISDKMLNNGTALKMIDEKDGSMQAIVSITLFKHIIPGYENMTFDQAKKWLFDRNVIGENSEPCAIGYRIPTQAQASIQALKFMDVLPEVMGDTVVLPEEFTKQTGSDFDIDKLFIARYQFNKKGEIIRFDEKLGMAENSEAAIKNKLVEQYIKVLTTTEYTNQLKVSIDNATSTVKGVLEKIEKDKPRVYRQAMSVYTPSYQEAVKSEYTVGKAGIGPFALNNAHHILTQLTELKFQNNTFTRALNLIDAGKQYDDDNSGRRILDWLSAMINAFVDIAKDPYIVRLNVNPFTYNMTSYLLRMGKGEQTFYFLNQPVIKDVAAAVMKVRGNYGKDLSRPQWEIETEVTNKVLEKYGITEDVLKYQKELLADPKQLAAALSGFFSQTTSGQYKLEQMLLNASEEDLNKFQAQVWLAWQAFMPYAQSMADLVKYSKVDTKKMGKSFAEQRVFEQGMRNLSTETGSRFADGEVSRFFEETFIATKTENSVGFGRSLFERQLLRNSPRFMESMDLILALMNKGDRVDERTLRTVITSMESSLKSEFFNQYAKDNNIDIKSLLYGNNTIAKRLMKIRSRIYNNELQDLKGRDGRFSNELLNFLIPNTVKQETTFEEPDYIDVKTMFNQDVHTKNGIIVAWEELLSHKDEEVRKFAEDLIMYAFVTSGDNKNMNSFFEFVPDSWRKSSGYSNFIEGLLQNGETAVDYRDFFLNNWMNDAIVPRISHTFHTQKFDPVLGIIDETEEFIGIKGRKPIEGTTEQPFLIFTGEAGSKVRIKPIGSVVIQEYARDTLVKRSYPIYPKFVKLRYGIINSPSSFVVYELVGYQEKILKSKERQYVPVYMAVNKKGYRYKGHNVVEYGHQSVLPFNNIPVLSPNDLRNGALRDGIRNNPRFTKELKSLYEDEFVTKLRNINELQSYKHLFSGTPYETQQEYELLQEQETVPVITQPEPGDPSEYTNYSGAALGADTVWAEIGREFGIGTQRDFTPEDLDNPRLTPENRQEIENAYQQAVRDLGRRALDPNTYRGKLVRRDYLQAKSADAIYAVGTISNGNVNGGTGYAVAMAKRMNKPVHVFDQTKNSWFVWNGRTFVQEDTPTLTKKYAGIGTREINEAGKQAIRDVYEKTFDKQTPNDSDILQQHLNNQETNKQRPSEKC